MTHADAAVGTTGTAASIASLVLVANPVGLTVVAVGATIYFAGRLAYDMYNTYFKD